MQLNTYQPTVYICLDLNAPLNCPLFLNITLTYDIRIKHRIRNIILQTLTV